MGIQGREVVFFTDRYCSTCSIVNNVLIEEVISFESEFKYSIKRVNLIDNKELANELAVTDSPTIIFPNGKRLVGYCTREEIRKMLR